MDEKAASVRAELSETSERRERRRQRMVCVLQEGVHVVFVSLSRLCSLAEFCFLVTTVYYCRLQGLASSLSVWAGVILVLAAQWALL